MDRTPAPVSHAAARALQPPEGSRAAEVFRDDHVWIRFAARPTSGPQVPHDRDEFYIVASGTARYRWDGGETMTISLTPATLAGSAFISTDDG